MQLFQLLRQLPNELSVPFLGRNGRGVSLDMLKQGVKLVVDKYGGLARPAEAYSGIGKPSQKRSRSGIAKYSTVLTRTDVPCIVFECLVARVDAVLVQPRST